MGRKRKVITEEELPPIPEAETAPPEPTLEELELQTFLQSVGTSEHKVKIFRFDRYGKEVYMGRLPLDACSEDRIQAEWGEGEYRVRLVNVTGNYVASRMLNIGAPLENIRAVHAPPVSVPAAPAENKEELFRMQVEAMRAELQNQRDLVYKLIDRIGASDGSKSSISEVAEAMKMLKDVSAPPTALSSLADIVTVFKQIREIAAPPVSEEGPRGIMGTIKDIVTAIPDVLQTMKGTPVQAPMMENTPRIPAQIAPENPALAKLRLGINYLKSKARAGREPDLYVDLIVDSLDDPQWLSFANLLEKPYDEVAALDPDLASPVYRPWFENLFNGLRDAIHNRISAGGADGNQADASENAETGIRSPAANENPGSGA